MVAVYARVSTLEQTENYSISSQVEKIKAYCMAKDWTIYDTYIDGGFTGTNIERPALQKMLSEMEHIDAVVVYKLDRLSRSQRDTLTLIEDYFLKNNVDFVSITETLDTSTPFGKAMVGILSVFAQLERETILERLVNGKIKRAESGLREMGGNYDPTGYARKNGVLVVKEDEARLVKLTYDLYEKYMSVTKVQQQIKKMGYPVWRFNRYIRVLKNRLYLGEIKYSGKFYKGVHEPIISEEQYNRVQKIMENHRGTNYNKTKNALLVGLIKCGCCGNNFVSYSTSTQAKTVYRYYVCRARRFPSEYIKKCTNRIMRRDTIEKFVIDELLNFEYAVNQREQNHADIDYDTLIAKIDKKISNALELYLEDEIDKEILNKKISKLNSDKNELVKEKLDTSKKKAISKDEFDQAILTLDTENDFNIRKSIVNKFIKKIVVHPDSIDIMWNLDVF